MYQGSNTKINLHLVVLDHVLPSKLLLVSIASNFYKRYKNNCSLRTNWNIINTNRVWSNGHDSRVSVTVRKNRIRRTLIKIIRFCSEHVFIIERYYSRWLAHDCGKIFYEFFWRVIGCGIVSIENADRPQVYSNQSTLVLRSSLLA